MSVELLGDVGSEAGRESVYSVLPRPFAWVVGFRHSAVWLGAAFGAGYLLVTAGVVAAVGRPTGGGWVGFVTLHLSYGLWIAGVPIAIAILVRGLERDVRDLAPVFGVEAGGEASLYREALTVAPRAVWLGVGAGLLMTIVALWFWFEVGPAFHLGRPFVTLREIAIEVAFFGAMGWAVGAALRLSQLTEARARPDLLAPRSFSALARNGARLAAVWLVFCAIGVPGALVAPEGIGEAVRMVMLMTLVLASFAVVALILPCRGAHRVLRSAKHAELEAVRRQIAEARAAREDTRLPGLLAWEARIEGLSEWPTDAPSLRRTGLFLLLPLASWVGSALVERLVDASMG